MTECLCTVFRSIILVVTVQERPVYDILRLFPCFAYGVAGNSVKESVAHRDSVFLEKQCRGNIVLFFRDCAEHIVRSNTPIIEIKHVPFHAGGRDCRVERHAEDIDNAPVNPMVQCILVRAVKGQFHVLLANEFAFREGYGDAVPLSPGNDSDEHLPAVEF